MSYLVLQRWSLGRLFLSAISSHPVSQSTCPTCSQKIGQNKDVGFVLHSRQPIICMCVWCVFVYICNVCVCVYVCMYVCVYICVCVYLRVMCVCV